MVSNKRRQFQTFAKIINTIDDFATRRRLARLIGNVCGFNLDTFFCACGVYKR
jgi:hypothetical protein